MTRAAREYRVPDPAVDSSPAISDRGSCGCGRPASALSKTGLPIRRRQGRGGLGLERPMKSARPSGLTGGKRNLMIQTVMTVCKFHCTNETRPSFLELEGSPVWFGGSRVVGRSWLDIRQNGLMAPKDPMGRPGLHFLSPRRAAASTKPTASRLLSHKQVAGSSGSARMPQIRLAATEPGCLASVAPTPDARPTK